MTTLSTLVRAAMNQAHTDIDRRGEKVTRVRLVAWCDEQRDGSDHCYDVVLSLRRSIIASALADADEADARNTAEAVAAERERIKETVAESVLMEMWQYDNDSIQEADWAEMRRNIATRAADALTRR